MAGNDQQLKMATIYKLATRVYGVNVIDPIEGVGETVKEDVEGLYRINPLKDGPAHLRANELVFYMGITTKLVYNPKSPLSLRRLDGKYWLFSQFNDEPLTDVRFTKRPYHYNLTTTSGTPMMEVGQAMGADCLAIAVDKQCHYFTNGTACKYCNITPTNITSGIPRFSRLEDIGELVKATGRKFRFFDLTGGTFDDTNAECKTYTLIGNTIKANLDKKEKYGGPFSLTPPEDLDLLEGLNQTDVDVISFNMDVWDLDALREICPGKFKIGREKYVEALLVAKELWGRGNVAMQFIVGPWESNESYLEGIRFFLEKGILVNLTTFAPSPNSPFRYKKSKSLTELIDLYVEYGELIRLYEFFPNERNSVLTSYVSNRSSISNESARGFITKENFDFEDLEKVVGGLNE